MTTRTGMSTLPRASSISSAWRLDPASTAASCRSAAKMCSGGTRFDTMQPRSLRNSLACSTCDIPNSSSKSSSPSKGSRCGERFFSQFQDTSPPSHAWCVIYPVEALAFSLTDSRFCRRSFRFLSMSFAPALLVASSGDRETSSGWRSKTRADIQPSWNQIRSPLCGRAA